MSHLHIPYSFDMIQMGKMTSGDFFETNWEITVCSVCGTEMTARRNATKFFKKNNPPDWLDDNGK